MADKFHSFVKGLTFKGLGVVQAPSGQMFFVRGVWPGDEGHFEIESLEKNYGYAKLIELTKESPHRRKSLCPHLGFQEGKCGGCPWMIADYNAQLQEKNNLVEYLLERATVVTDQTKIHPILPSPKELAYRNRAQFKTNGEVLGYVSPQSRAIAPIQECVVLTEKNQKTLDFLLKKLPNPDWKPQGKWDWNFIEISDESEEILLNQKKSFRQANDHQNLNMKKWLRELVQDFEREHPVLELFCGSGNFTEVFSELGFKKIIASEVSEEAISELNSKNLKNVKAIREDIYKPAGWKKLKALAENSKILFLDPPREGFSEIQKFIKEFSSIEYIIYVSCDLSTFTADVKKLRGQKYELVEVQPIDQFPQTPHIEILSYLKKTTV